MKFATNASIAILTIFLALLSCSNNVSSTNGAPPAPLSVSAAGVSMSVIRVEWVRILGAVSYNVFRAQGDSGAYSLAGSVEADSFYDTGLVSGANYSYKVSAENHWGESGKSTAIFATTAYPVNVLAAGLSASSIAITWQPVAGAASYNAYRGETDTGTFVAAGAVVGDTFVDTGLSSGTAYYYKVSAASGSQQSRLTLPVHGITIPAAPLSVRADTIFAGQIRLVWLPAAGAISYKVYRSPGDTAAYDSAGTSLSDSFTDANPVPGTRSYYEVTAINLSGESQKSVVISALAVPPAPDSLVANALSSTQAVLTWDSSRGAQTYKIYRSTSDTFGAVYAVAGVASSDTFYDSALSSDTQYYYKISAIDSSGESPRSAVDSVKLLQTGMIENGPRSERKEAVALAVHEGDERRFREGRAFMPQPYRRFRYYRPMSYCFRRA